MNDLDYRLGRVVYSKMGRDKGRYFVVTAQCGEDFVMIADGSLRKLCNQKRKRLKHLEPKPCVLESVAEKLADGRKVFDSEVRSALEAAGFVTRFKQE